MAILDDIREHAKDITDMQTELAKEIYSTSIDIRLRMVKIVTAKSSIGNDLESIPMYLCAIDFIDDKLGEYKKTYLEIKTRCVMP